MSELKTGDVLDPMMVKIDVVPQAIKATGEITMMPEQVEAQAEAARRNLVAVADDARGTCLDERERLGTRAYAYADQAEPRPSVAGGPDIYGLYVAEFSGYFGDSGGDVETNLSQVKNDINRKRIKSGGHDHCAANASFGPIVSIIANPDNALALKSYAKANQGDSYDEAIADEVLGFAIATDKSGRYADHEEATLGKVYGDEAGEAIETLADVPHEGRTIIRQSKRGYTVDQTALHNATGGEDSFVFDDWYADDIENALASGPEAARMKKRMRTAREFLIAAVAQAVPNKELHQINLS